MGKRDSPGPIYKLPTTIGYAGHDSSRYRNPQYSISPRLDAGAANTCSPGPIYQVRGLTEYGRQCRPAFSIVSRYPELVKHDGPGPAGHSPEKCPRMKEPRPPAYTMRPKLDIHSETLGPGPLAYNLPSMLGPKVPNKLASGAYTISPRLESYGKYCGPGPASYGTPDANVYKIQAPKFTMRPANREFGDKTCSPGPAAYSFQPICGEKGPAFSMGVRYADEITPYITANDLVPCKKSS